MSFILLLRISNFYCFCFHNNHEKQQRYLNFFLSGAQSHIDPFKEIQPSESVGDINRWLVQKGFKFDSYRRRFDFGGYWARDSSQSVGVQEFLQARGLSDSESKFQATRPYTQRFERERVSSKGIVFRILIDGSRRNTTYELGDWSEEIPSDFNSSLFKDGSTLKRSTRWEGTKHITETTFDQNVFDRTIRYLESNDLIVERISRNTDGKETSCREVFVRSYSDAGEVRTSSLQRVPGCVANVDIQTTIIEPKIGEDHRIQIDGEADALVSRGLLAVLSEVFGHLSAREVLSLEPISMAEKLGLRDVLSTGRNDGLASICKVVQSQIRKNLNCDDEVVGHKKKETGGDTQPTVAVLLSGGVDSAVALNILKRKGYSIVAFYLKIWLEDELSHLGKCPWEEDYRICEAICAQANVPLETISLQDQYKEKVISYTVFEAERGRTPNPDIMCNSRVKFGCFYDAIEDRGFDNIASGHYAQLVTDNETGKKLLMRAPDPVKDQSYFLCTLTQQQLKNILFPIGHLQKAEVRKYANEFDLPNKDRPDSQGLCFLGKVKFDEFLAAYLGDRPGSILDATTGQVLGRHNGVWYHTVGQRKGIGKVLDPKATSRGPWYVVSKDPEKNIVFVSNKYDEESFAAARTDVAVEDIHWIAGKLPPNLFDETGLYQLARFQMKIRHGPKIVTGTLMLEDSTTGNVKLDQKDGGLAPGQFIAFYDINNAYCLGAGVISERHWARFLTTRETEIKSI